MPASVVGWTRIRRSSQGSPFWHPVGETGAEIHQGVADGGHLPVEDADHLERVAGVEDDVVEPEVAVDDAGSDLGGLVSASHSMTRS